MHPLVRLYLRTAFLFLALGLLGGLWIEFQLVSGGTISHGMIVAHVHLLLVGFLLMTIFGVAFWLFPRSGRGQPIGPYPNLVAFAYGLLTLGTVVRAGTEFFDLQLNAQTWGYVRLAASSAQVAGIAIGVVALWGRIRGAAFSKLDSPPAEPPAGGSGARPSSGAPA
jgi:cbb3-type cytochrome oxidase subunit 1